MSVVSVIRGSSLLSTKSDLRHMVQRGGVVIIDGVEVKLSDKPHCEWSDRRLELSSDWTGDTKIQATLTVRNLISRSPKKKTFAQPVASEDIQHAVAPLYTMSTNTSHAQVAPQNRRAFAPAPPKRRQSLGAIPSTGTLFNDFDSSAPGSYLASLLQQKLNLADAQEEQRRQAKLRVEQKRKEDSLEEMRRAKEEQDRKAAVHAQMEIKAQSLRDKTAMRVSSLQKAKSEEDRAKREALELQQKRKADADAVVQSEEYEKRMQRLRLESKQRLKAQRSAEDARKQERDVQLQKTLFEISEQRRRHDHGPVKKKAVSKKCKPSAVEGYSTSVEMDMERDLGFSDNAYEESDAYREDYYDNYVEREPPKRVSKSAEAVRTVAPVPVAPRFSLPPPAAAANDEDDDDDGYWSRDSLGDDDWDDGFQEPAELSRRGAAAPSSPSLMRHHAQSVDVSDDFTAVSAITLGSPKKQQKNHTAISANPVVKPRATFKPLKPLPIRPFAPLPAHK